MSGRQTYKYVKLNSILGNESDEYQLSEIEYYKLYSFYVEHSLCSSQSYKGKNFIFYGWPSDSLKNNPLKNHLNRILDFNNSSFIFTKEDNLIELFQQYSLEDGVITDFTFERAVISKTNENNKYLKLFHRVRNGFAHGKFRLRYSQDNIKFIIIQDDDGHNVTARIVIKLDTLLSFVDIIGNGYYNR